ncbi:phosphogluconate dehydrogenase (NAD(+)-dependent, decarboxylating) [Singulisphaera sp. Ch08]|uniref:Phosphogluconate dehydrogenase (NAD(+)-dependent, decarboxylating) n=1 Tax=Singulisphaera sp. Ch08 TaxID=3120278 RepID=A0AAU7CHG7_9BACT
MQLGMIGLGRMGSNMVRRLLAGGHQCVAFDVFPNAVAAVVKEGAVGTASLAEFVQTLAKPRAVWLMVPAAVVDQTLQELVPLLEAGDLVIDGGNSYYVDDIRRAGELRAKGVHYVDVGTSGGVWGLERGYCMMIGGEAPVVSHLDPIFQTLAPPTDSAPRTTGREALGGTAEHGYLHCGPSGAGHFVKMVHNGIEYGIMAAYAEGMAILNHANIGKQTHEIDAETTPLRHPEHYQYDINVRDVAELWRRGSVISSWLLDLTASALLRDPALANFSGRVSDSGEGRWTVKAAIDEAVPAPVLTTALFERFYSRGESDFADKLLSAMRYEFGGHVEKPAG